MKGVKHLQQRMTPRKPMQKKPPVRWISDDPKARWQAQRNVEAAARNSKPSKARVTLQDQDGRSRCDADVKRVPCASSDARPRSQKSINPTHKSKPSVTKPSYCSVVAPLLGVGTHTRKWKRKIVQAGQGCW